MIESVVEHDTGRRRNHVARWRVKASSPPSAAQIASNGLRRNSAYQHCNLINLQMFHSAFKRDSLNLMKECDAQARLARWLRFSQEKSDQMVLSFVVMVVHSVIGFCLHNRFELTSKISRSELNRRKSELVIAVEEGKIIETY